METATTSSRDTWASLRPHSSTETTETERHRLTATVDRILGNVQALLVPGSTKRTVTDSARLRVTETAMLLLGIAEKSMIADSATKTRSVSARRRVMAESKTRRKVGGKDMFTETVTSSLGGKMADDSSSKGAIVSARRKVRVRVETKFGKAYSLAGTGAATQRQHLGRTVGVTRAACMSLRVPTWSPAPNR